MAWLLVARLLSILLSASKIHVHSFHYYYVRLGFAIVLSVSIKCICWSLWHHTSEYDMKLYALVKFILYHVSNRTGTSNGINKIVLISNNEHQCSTIGLLLLTSWFKCRNSILMMKELMCVNSIVNGFVQIYWFIFKLPMQLIDCDLPNLSLLFILQLRNRTKWIQYTVPDFSHNGILFKSLQMFKWVFPSFFNIFFPVLLWQSNSSEAFSVWICNCFQ